MKLNRKILLLLAVFVIFLLLVSAIPVGTSGVTEDVSGIYITIEHPVGWHTKEARVEINFEDTQLRGVRKIEVRLNAKDAWIDVTDNPSIVLTDNATVYVQIHDRTGLVTVKSRYIECFDREKPTVNAALSGSLLRVEAHDTISGISAIYINGFKYSNLVNNTIDVRLSDHDDGKEKILIQAVDNAGNLSLLYSMENPLTKAAKTSSSNSSPSSSSSSSSETSKATPPSDAKATTTSEAPPGPGSTIGGTAESSGDEPRLLPDQQFLIVTTKSGKIFYLIVDNTKTDNNVYLLTEVTENDLLNFVNAEEVSEEDVGDLIDGGELPEKVELDVEEEGNSTSSSDAKGDSSSGIETVTDGASQDGEGQNAAKGNPIPGWIVISIIAFVALFAGYLFLVKLPKKRAKESFEDDDSDDSDEEEQYVDEEYFDEEPDETSSTSLPSFPSSSGIESTSVIGAENDSDEGEYGGDDSDFDEDSQM